MREIVDRLKENRQVELAKSILENNGYTVSKLDEEDPKPEWQYIEYTDKGPETYLVMTEEEAQKAIDKLNAEGIEAKGPTPITRQDESSDEDDEIDEWDPYRGMKYKVYGGDNSDSVGTNDPKKAIEAWFKLGQDAPMDTAIMSKTKADAIELNKAATEEYLTDLHSKYRCPYKLDYLVDEAAKKVADGQRGFYEDKYGYGDSVHPFSVG